MKKIPIDEAPAGMWLDLAAAEAMGYIRVSIEQAKKTPTELLDIPVTEERYVYVFVDDWEDHNSAEGVWRRRHGAGDFRMWQPSLSITDAWELAEKENMALVPRGDGENWAAIPRGGYTEASYWHLDDGSIEYGLYEHTLTTASIAPSAPLAICRAYLRAKGVRYVEVRE